MSCRGWHISYCFIIIIVMLEFFKQIAKKCISYQDRGDGIVATISPIHLSPRRCRHRARARNFNVPAPVSFCRSTVAWIYVLPGSANDRFNLPILLLPALTYFEKVKTIPRNWLVATADLYLHTNLHARAHKLLSFVDICFKKEANDSAREGPTSPIFTVAL